MDIILRLEEEKDYRCVENLTREAFWNVYKPGCDEHFLLHQMRRSPDSFRNSISWRRCMGRWWEISPILGQKL